MSTYRGNGFWLFAVGWIALGLAAVPGESLGAAGADRKTLRETITARERTEYHEQARSVS